MIQSGYRYALALTHSTHDAEDLVQTAFLKLYRRHGNVENKALFITTIRNQFIDQRRRAKLIVFQPESDMEQEEAEPTATPGSALDLEAILSHLRPEEREALYLNIVEGYSAREIAELTGKPRNTVLSLIHRGKEKLNEFVSAHEARKTGSTRHG